MEVTHERRSEPSVPRAPRPTPDDLKKAVDAIPEGPNVEASPWEQAAAKGETPLEGPRPGDTDAQGRPASAQDAQRQASGAPPR